VTDQRQVESPDRSVPFVTPPDLQSGQCSVVVIAASVGGLAAISTILAALSSDFPAAIAIVQHRLPKPSTMLESLLGRVTPLVVKAAESGDRMQAGMVYVAPPDFHMVINDGHVALSHSPKVRFSRPSADQLFLSAAEHVNSRLIAVVLTGGNSDGTEGIRAIKRMGGTVIAQDEATSDNFTMPKSAIATGDVDYILPISEIGPALLALVQKADCGFRKRTDPAHYS
jgi:two-component system, chemotaxis family, protein-glutamate methylesterase/glutaminase